MSVSNK